MHVLSTAPDAYVVFYPYQRERTRGLDIRDQATALAVDQVLVRNEIISITRAKSKSGGTFSITLSSASNWKSRLHPGAWCVIYMSDRQLTGEEGGELNSGFKMLGMIKSVRRQESVSKETGTRSIRYVISGEDFQTIFNCPIYINVNIARALAGDDSFRAAFFSLFEDKRLGDRTKPHDIVNVLVDNLIGRANHQIDPQTNEVLPSNSLQSQTRSGAPVQVPTEVYRRILGPGITIRGNLFAGMLANFLQTNLVGMTTFTQEIGGNVSAWSLIQAWANSMLNEVYTELLPVNVDGRTVLRPSVVLRAIPFSNQRIHPSNILFRDAESVTADPKSIPSSLVKQNQAAHFYVSKVISEGEIYGIDHGKSDGERFSFFFVPPNISLFNQNTNEIELISDILSRVGRNNIADDVSIARYGSRPYVSSSSYRPDSESSKALFTQIVVDLWKDAYLYENGVVSIAGSAEYIPVGTNIVFGDRGWVAHVEQVQDTFTVAPDGKKAYRTNISFVRLQKVNGGGPIDLTEARAEAGREIASEHTPEHGGAASTTFKPEGE
jgi:hypothetical protein